MSTDDMRELRKLALREVAEWVEDTYSPDVFVPLTKDQLETAHACLKASGMTLDGLSAQMGRAIARNIRRAAEASE
jgi:hypothetical protein